MKIEDEYFMIVIEYTLKCMIIANWTILWNLSWIPVSELSIHCI